MTFSIAGTLFFMVLAMGSFSDEEEEDYHRAFVERYVNQHSKDTLIRNALFLGEMEGLFAYTPLQASPSRLFSKEAAITIDSSAADHHILTVQPHYNTSGNDLPLASEQYLAPINGYVLKDYHLRFKATPALDSVMALSAVVYFREEYDHRNIDTMVVDDNSLWLEHYLLKDPVDQQSSEVSGYFEEKSRTEQLKTQDQKFEHNCLDAYDGSCITLEDFVLLNLKYPQSYRHVSTKFWNRGNYAEVLLRYRAKNSKGEQFDDHVKAKVNWNCEIIEITERG